MQAEYLGKLADRFAFDPRDRAAAWRALHEPDVFKAAEFHESGRAEAILFLETLGFPHPARWRPRVTGPPDPHRRAIARLRAAWAAPGGPPPVLFGPRRQGKTTLVRRLAGSPHLLGGDARAAVLNLQAVDWTDGAADLCHAIAFALWQADPDGLAEPAPEDYERGPLAALHLLLSRLERAAPPRRYILVLDEYELLDELDPGEGTAILGALRAPAWLAVALVGLRPPDECAGGLREALAGAPAIPVGRLGRAAFAALLRAGDPVRPSRFAPDALGRAFALAGGQPFLGTLLVELLTHRVAPGADATSTFTAADVDAVAETPEFALGARPYYRCLLYTSPSPRDGLLSRMPSSA